MAITRITDYRGYCVKDYDDTCIILSRNQAIFGCGTLWARIWRAGISTNAEDEKDQASILLITELQ